MNNLITRMGLISDNLKSKEIIDYLNQWSIDKMFLLKLVIESKIGYDKLSSDPENASYFLEIEESTIYSTGSYSELIMVISTLGDNSKNNFQHNNLLNKFYLFHKMLYRTANLVSNLLSKHNDSEQQNQSGSQGNTIINPLLSNLITQNNSNSILNPLAETAKPASKLVSMNDEHSAREGKDSNNSTSGADDDLTLGNFLKSISGI